MGDVDLFGQSDIFNEFTKDQPSQRRYLRKRGLEATTDESLTDEESDDRASPEIWGGTDMATALTMIRQQTEKINDLKRRREEDDDRSTSSTSPLTSSKVTAVNCSAVNEDNLKTIMELKETVKDLEAKLRTAEAENVRFDSCRKVLVPDTLYPSDSLTPGIIVMYLNNKFSRKRKLELEEKICQVFDEEKKDTSCDDRDLNDRCKFFNDGLALGQLSKKPRTHNWNEFESGAKMISSCQYFTDFIVDLYGLHLFGDRPEVSDGWANVFYAQVFVEALTTSTIFATCGPDTIAKTHDARFIFNSCFNCDGLDHQIGDCPKPRNVAHIQKRRTEMAMEKMRRSQMGPAGPSAPPKYPDHVPGFISDSLREALGIKHHELPPYIYRMRSLASHPVYGEVYGYPPGWVAESMLNEDAVGIFDGEGLEVDKEGKKIERTEETIKFNYRLIPEWPGFNSPVPNGVNDAMMPRREHFYEREKLKQLSCVVDVDEIYRHSPSPSPSPSKDEAEEGAAAAVKAEDDDNTADDGMDLSSTEDGVEAITVEDDVISEVRDDDEEDGEVEEIDLEALEEQKRNILAALNVSSSTATTCDGVTSGSRSSSSDIISYVDLTDDDNNSSRQVVNSTLSLSTTTDSILIDTTTTEDEEDIAGDDDVVILDDIDKKEKHLTSGDRMKKEVTDKTKEVMNKLSVDVGGISSTAAGGDEGKGEVVELDDEEENLAAGSNEIASPDIEEMNNDKQFKLKESNEDGEIVDNVLNDGDISCAGNDVPTSVNNDVNSPASPPPSSSFRLGFSGNNTTSTPSATAPTDKSMYKKPRLVLPSKQERTGSGQEAADVPAPLTKKSRSTSQIITNSNHSVSAVSDSHSVVSHDRGVSSPPLPLALMTRSASQVSLGSCSVDLGTPSFDLDEGEFRALPSSLNFQKGIQEMTCPEPDTPTGRIDRIRELLKNRRRKRKR